MTKKTTNNIDSKRLLTHIFTGLIGLVSVVTVTKALASPSSQTGPKFNASQALELCDASNKKPCVVEDTEIGKKDLKNWRDAKMILESYKANTTGLNDFWMSGSDAPSSDGFKMLVDNIKQSTQEKVKKIIVVDLRQESHLYLNGNSLTLYGERDWINLGKSNNQALTDEQDWLDSLKSKAFVFNVLTNKQLKSQNFLGRTVKVNSVVSEKDLTQKFGLEYKRLMVSDHMRPRPEEVASFVTFVKDLPEDTWLHFHCRGGKGRTTTFMAMYDILKNAKKVSFDHIIKRQAAVAPFYDLSAIKNDTVLGKLSEERYQFLKEFYNSVLTDTVF